MKYERILQNSDMVSAREHGRLFLHRPTLYSLRSHSISSGVHRRLYFFLFLRDSRIYFWKSYSGNYYDSFVQ